MTRNHAALTGNLLSVKIFAVIPLDWSFAPDMGGTRMPLGNSPVAGALDNNEPIL